MRACNAPRSRIRCLPPPPSRRGFGPLPSALLGVVSWSHEEYSVETAAAPAVLRTSATVFSIAAILAPASSCVAPCPCSWMKSATSCDCLKNVVCWMPVRHLPGHRELAFELHWVVPANFPERVDDHLDLLQLPRQAGDICVKANVLVIACRGHDAGARASG